MLTIVTLTPARIVARATNSPSELSLLGQQRRFAISGMARPPASLLFQYRRASGVRSLWNGFPPYYLRCGGHTVSMFIFVEYLRSAYVGHFA